MGPKHHWKVSCSIKKIWYCCELDLEFLLLTSRVLGARVPSAPSPWPDPGTWPLLTLYPAIAAGPSLPPFFSPLHCCNKTSIMLHLPNKPPSPSCWVISQLEYHALPSQVLGDRHGRSGWSSPVLATGGLSLLSIYPPPSPSFSFLVFK